MAARIGLPVRMLNRHGLVCRAPGTGRTITLQVLAEQIAAAAAPFSQPTSWGTSRPRSAPADPSLLEQLSRVTMVRQLARTAGQEIFRGLFGTRRRR